MELETKIEIQDARFGLSIQWLPRHTALRAGTPGSQDVILKLFISDVAFSGQGKLNG
ncbi:MAG: hypothetical protein IPL46_16815 [Saprospiraceae bacterium]|nr:hypothetical protein [Saprospiraceae bacterium]